MAKILVQTETPIDRGWEFLVSVARAPDEDATEHRVRLSWADYELWSHGVTPPERVAAAVATFCLEALGGEPMAASFDAATLRRRFPRMDERIPALLGAG